MEGWLCSRTRVIVLWCVVALGAALALDGAIARLAAPYANIIKHDAFAHELKEFGHLGFTVFFAVFVAILHRSGWRGGVMMCISAALTGVINPLVKWIVGRQRPIVGGSPFTVDPFRGGWDGLFNEPNLSFPSGHAALAFATASALAFLLPRGRWAFYAVAGGVALERVAERAHFLSDVVASAILGIVATRLAVQMCKLMREPHRADSPAFDLQVEQLGYDPINRRAKSPVKA
jgi:membrane-associated phospholipid phosphatase